MCSHCDKRIDSSDDLNLQLSELGSISDMLLVYVENQDAKNQDIYNIVNLLRKKISKASETAQGSL